MVHKMVKYLAGLFVFGLAMMTTLAIAYAANVGDFQYNFGFTDESGCTEEYNNYQFITYYACPDGCDYYPIGGSLTNMNCENLDTWVDYDYDDYAGFWDGVECSGDYQLFDDDRLYYCETTGCWAWIDGWEWACFDYYVGDFEYDFEINSLCTEEYNSYIFQTYYACPDGCDYYSRTTETGGISCWTAASLNLDYSGESFWDEICNDYEAYTGTMQCFDNDDICWYYVEDYTYWCNSGETGTWSASGGSVSDTSDDTDSYNWSTYCSNYDDFGTSIYCYDDGCTYDADGSALSCQPDETDYDYDDVDDDYHYYAGYFEYDYDTNSMCNQEWEGTSGTYVYLCPDSCWYFNEGYYGYYWCEDTENIYYYTNVDVWYDSGYYEYVYWTDSDCTYGYDDEYGYYYLCPDDCYYYDEDDLGFFYCGGIHNSNISYEVEYFEGYFEYNYWLDYRCAEDIDGNYNCPDNCTYYIDVYYGYYYCEDTGEYYYYHTEYEYSDESSDDSSDDTSSYNDYEEDWDAYWDYVYYDDYYYDPLTGCYYYYDGGSWCEDYYYGYFEYSYEDYCYEYYSDWDGYYYYCDDGCWYYYDAYYCDGYWYYYDEYWLDWYDEDIWWDCYDYGYYYYCPAEDCYYYEDGYVWCNDSYDADYWNDCEDYGDYYYCYDDGCYYYDEMYYCDGYYYWYDWDYMYDTYDDLGWWDYDCHEYEDYWYGGYYYCDDECYYYTDYEYAWCGDDIGYYWDYEYNSYDCWYDANGYYVCDDGCYYYDYYYYCDGYMYYYEDYWYDYWYDYADYDYDYWDYYCDEYYDSLYGYYYYCWDDGCWYFDDYYYCDDEYYYYYDYTYDTWDGCSYGYDYVYGDYYYCPDDGCYYYDYWYECTETGYYDDWYYDTYSTYVPTTDYSDVEPWNPYIDAIDYLSENEVIEGYDDGTYKPNADVNRVEALKIIFATLDNVLDIYEIDTSSLYVSSNMSFSDIDDGSWYIPYLEQAFLLGIVEGYEDGTYKPGNTVNKVEILKIIIEAFDLEYMLDENVTELLYPDVDTTAWYAKYVQLANELGIFYDLALSDDFEPGDNMTRGEIADLVYRFADAIYLEDDVGGRIF